MSWSIGLIVLLLLIVALWLIAELMPHVPSHTTDYVAARKRRDAARAYRTRMGMKE